MSINRLRNAIRNTILLGVILCITSASYAKTPDCCKYLFNNQGIATQNLSNLLKVTSVEIKGSKDIGSICQSGNIQSWYTHPNIERWDLKLSDKLKDKTNNIINICENELHMKEEVLPKNVQYSGVLFLGATLKSVINRTQFYNKLLEQGIINKNLKIWVLTGERNLSAKAGETQENFLKLVPHGQKNINLPLTELDMIKFVFYYMMPKNSKIEYLCSQKEQNYTRATTASTIYTWLEKIQNPPEKTYYLAISNQPYVNYQESVINLAISKTGKKNIIVHVIGDKSQSPKDHNNYAAILLDTVAKTVSNCCQGS